VALADDEGAGAALAVEERGAQIGNHVAPGAHALIEPALEYSVDQFFEISDVPPAFHIGLAEPE